jgi:hypothetical protein
MLDWVGEISGGRKGLCLLGDYFFFQATLSLSLFGEGSQRVKEGGEDRRELVEAQTDLLFCRANQGF